MLDTVTPIGTTLRIPETIAEDATYFAPEAIAQALTYYEDQGYVVLRQLIPRELCARVRAAFAADARASTVPVLRQKTMRYERHSFDADGFLDNPIFNVQDLATREYGGFRAAALDILAHPTTARATAALLRGERAKLIQSMFFEAPAGTWAHQDSYYQDSASGLGGCVAGWFALEDIDAGAGRFWICPGSHRSMSPLRNEGALNFATGHQTYQQAMLEAVRAHGLPWSAPCLEAGDVLFWNSLTVHGSLPASRRGVSRASLTAHYLREDDAMLQFHARIRRQETTTHNGMTVGLLHDQNRSANRLLRQAAFHFPKPYMTARRVALAALLAKRSAQQAIRLRRRAAAVPAG